MGKENFIALQMFLSALIKQKFDFQLPCLPWSHMVKCSRIKCYWIINACLTQKIVTNKLKKNLRRKYFIRAFWNVLHPYALTVFSHCSLDIWPSNSQSQSSQCTTKSTLLLPAWQRVGNIYWTASIYNSLSLAVITKHCVWKKRHWWDLRIGYSAVKNALSSVKWLFILDHSGKGSVSLLLKATGLGTQRKSQTQCPFSQAHTPLNHPLWGTGKNVLIEDYSMQKTVQQMVPFSRFFQIYEYSWS